MAAPPRPRFVDSLPAVFRQDEVGGENFLHRFLRAFEVLFDEVQGEIESVPGLFSVSPTPLVDVDARAGDAALALDSAAGLCPGDVLLLDGGPGRSELVEVVGVEDDLLPRAVAVREPLRMAHPRGRRLVLVVGEVSAGVAALPVAPAQGEEETEHLTVTAGVAAGIAAGDAVRVGVGPRAEHARVVEARGHALRVEPPLRRLHEAGTPVALLRWAEGSTPPPAFAHTRRAGTELVLDAPAAPPDVMLELDSVTGLAPGDVLHVRDLDPDRVEFLRVKALPLADAVPAVRRFAVEVQAPVRFAHAPGTGVEVLREPAGATVLADPVAEGAFTLVVRDPLALGVRPGEAIRVGGEHVEVRGTMPETRAPDEMGAPRMEVARLTVTPRLSASHPRGTAVERIVGAGAGTAQVEWLAGWIGLDLRPGRGERWSRELVRRAGRIWPHRGTARGIEAFLNAWLQGEATATVFDPSNPLQVGMVSTVGQDTIVCGGIPDFFWVDVETAPRSTRLHSAEGINELVQAAHAAVRREKPAHTWYALRVRAGTLQVGVDPRHEIGARVGDTTLLWGEPLTVYGDR